jgi:hypothetical protein
LKSLTEFYNWQPAEIRRKGLIKVSYAIRKQDIGASSDAFTAYFLGNESANFRQYQVGCQLRHFLCTLG